MSDPTASRPRSPNFMARGSELLPWSWAVSRLEAERNYWIASVTSQSMPHARPVWGVYVDDLLFISVGAAGLRRGEDRRDVSVHVDDAMNVVIIDGVAERIVDEDERRRASAVYNPKYEMAADAEFVNFRVIPRVAWGWRDGDVETATKWTFADGASPIS